MICDCKTNCRKEPLILCAEISPVIVAPTPTVTHTFRFDGPVDVPTASGRFLRTFPISLGATAGADFTLG